MKTLFLLMTLCVTLPAFAGAETKTYRIYDNSGNYKAVVKDHGTTSTVWSTDGKYLGRMSKTSNGDTNIYSGNGSYQGKVRPSRDYSNDEDNDDD